MNTLAHFRWNGTDDQRDPLEGASAFVLPRSIPTLPDDLQDIQTHKSAILPAGLSYANICCFFMQTARFGQDEACMESPHAPDNLGGYYVATDDFPALVDRIDLARQASLSSLLLRARLVLGHRARARTREERA